MPITSPGFKSALLLAKESPCPLQPPSLSLCSAQACAGFPSSPMPLSELLCSLSSVCVFGEQSDRVSIPGQLCWLCHSPLGTPADTAAPPSAGHQHRAGQPGHPQGICQGSAGAGELDVTRVSWCFLLGNQWSDQ